MTSSVNVDRMKLEDKVATLEQCKKLVELGVKLETEKYWQNTHSYQDNFILTSNPNRTFEKYAAPDVAELGVLLGKFRVVKTSRTTHDWRLESMDFTIMGYSPFFNIELEVQARAEALIWLLENKHLKLEDLKL